MSKVVLVQFQQRTLMGYKRESDLTWPPQDSMRDVNQTCVFWVAELIFVYATAKLSREKQTELNPQLFCEYTHKMFTTNYLYNYLLIECRICKGSFL